MAPDKIIYTDGHDVTVTQSELKVKNHNYNLNGIIKYWLQTIKPFRLPWILLLGLGAASLVLGFLNLFPYSWNFYAGEKYIFFNSLMVWTGGIVLVISSIVLIFSKDRYAIRIATAEGERNAVVSDRREYISQIDGALNRAFSPHLKSSK